MISEEEAKRVRLKKKRRAVFLKGVAVGLVSVFLAVIFTIAILLKLNVISIMPGSMGGNGVAEKIYNKLNVIENRLQAFYFDEADEDVIIDNVCKAYLDSFNDKYTTYFAKDEFTTVMQSNTGSFVGIGVLVSKNEDGTIEAQKVYDDSPAQKGGLKDGDTIISVDGKSVKEETLDETVARIKGAKGTKVKVVVKHRGSDEEIEYELARDVVDYIMVDSLMLENDIGYIAISQFSEVTLKQFQSCYDQCIADGAKGIVVDVRNNPGGLLNSVCDILDTLVPDGIIVYTEDKFGKRVDYKGSNKAECNIPMVVLTNGNSASASEIFAACLQDYEKAKIVGTTTFGKGIVQTMVSLGDGSAIKYTTSKYFSPKGQDIHGNGVKPDVEVELDLELLGTLNEEKPYKSDSQIVKGVEVLRDMMK